MVDKDKVWRDWNKKLSKFGKAVWLWGAAVDIVGGLILDAVDWVMDPEGGKVHNSCLMMVQSLHII